MEQQAPNKETDRNNFSAKGRFLPGNNVGKAGRPKGSRNLLSQRFVDDVFEMWSRRGAEILERIANEDPVAAARLVANLLPQKTEVDMTLGVQVVQLPSPRSHAELEALHSQRLLDLKPEKAR